MKQQTTKAIAFFGPSGSNTELALVEHLQPSDGISCRSIAEVFHKVANGTTAAGFVPLENILQGPIAETLDLLLEYQGRVYIAESYVSEIIHAFGVLPTDISKENIKKSIKQVYSHEQPLRQCSNYLLKNFPEAELCPAASTSSAASLVKDKQLRHAGVIAAPSTLAALGFIVLDEDISDLLGNKTRFALLRRGDITSKDGQLKLISDRGPTLKDDQTYTTSVVISPGRDRQGLLCEILEVISIKHRVNLSSIHSRPDAKGGFVFHLDLEGHLGDVQVNECLDALKHYCLHTTGQTAEIIVCGCYPRSKFYALPFRTIGIIGGAGSMGRWFRNFWESIGLEVLICDKNEGISLAELCARAEVVLLSVPMTQSPVIAKELYPLLKRNQLVVENCSIKGVILPELLDFSPSGVEVLGIHTMFGGEAASLRGENIIVTKTDRSGPKAQAFEDLLYKYGAIITYASVKEHDRQAAFQQSLVHFAALCLADIMKDSFENPASLEPFSTPNSRSLLQIIRRVLGQSNELLNDLQNLNQEYPELRRKFVDAATRFAQELEEGKNTSLEERVNKVRKFLAS